MLDRLPQGSQLNKIELVGCLATRAASYLMVTQVSGRPLSWETYEAADGKHPIFHTLPGARGTAFFGWQVVLG